MYSIVMLTAMSAGADVTPPPAPAPRVVAAPMVAGCTGSCFGSCHGSVSYGCSGSCHGCSGGGFLGLRARHSCHGCTGCTGYAWRGACHGSGCSDYSCFGSCHGGISYGSSWGPPIGMAPYTLHGYNSGADVVWGPGAPVVVYGKITNMNPNPPPVMVIPVEPMVKPKGSDTMPMGANLKFKVPADAKLFVDGKETPGSGPERAFFTPPLERGKKFFYEVKVEYTADGKKKTTDVEKVIVEAGDNKVIELPKAGVASN